jgi:hypothetical protein
MNKPQFEVVPDEDEQPSNPEVDSSKAVDILLLLLKPLSQKTLIALGSLFSLLTVVSVFWLCLVIIPNSPTTQQLIGLGGYAVFVIAVNIIVRRK